MAMSKDSPPAAAEPARSAPPAPVAAAAGAPGWIVPLYVGGLALVFIGERILEATPTAHVVATALGVLAVCTATILRFSPRFRAGGERRAIERMLAALSLVGVVALLFYLATTDWGAERIGLASLELEKRENVEAILTVLWVSLICLSVVPMLFAEAAHVPMRRAERPESRRVRAAAASGLALALAAIYGALFVYAAQGVKLEVDYSYFKTSRPSDATKRVAQALTEPVRVVAFFPDVNEVKVEVEGYLRELVDGVPKIKLEVHDRLLAPKLARDLRATQDGVIVLARDSTNESLVIGTDMKAARAKLKTLDTDFQEKLLKVVRARRTAYLTVGHGELNDAPKGGPEREEGRDARIVRTLLQKQNYLVKNLGLSQGLAREVPEDADIVLIFGPSEPFSSEEVGALRRYAERGGKLFIAADPDASPTSDLTVEASEAANAPEEEPEPAAETPPKPAPSASASAGKPAQPAKKPGEAGSAKKPAAVASAKKPGDMHDIAAKSAAGKKAKASEPPAPPAPPPSPAVASLESLTAVTGLSFTPTLLANERDHVRRRFNNSDRLMLVTNSFSSHASVSTLSRNSSRAAIVVSGAGSLERASGSNAKVDFTVRSLQGTFADANRNYAYDKGTEKQAVYNLAAAVTSPVAGNGKQPPAKKEEKKDDKKGPKKAPPPNEMRAFVVADSDVFSDVFMANVIANQVLLVDAVRWLGGEESFAGEVNSEEDVRIEHTKQKDLIWFYGTIFGAPALVLAAGVAASRRARKKHGGRKP